MGGGQTRIPPVPMAKLWHSYMMHYQLMSRPLTMPAKRPRMPCSRTMQVSTSPREARAPHCRAVFAQSKGVVAVAAHAPDRAPMPKCSYVRSFFTPLWRSRACANGHPNGVTTTSICTGRLLGLHAEQGQVPARRVSVMYIRTGQEEPSQQVPTATYR